MLNIIKYEWMSRWKFFLSGVILFVLLNVEMLRNAIERSTPTKFVGILSLVLFFMGATLFFDHIGRMYRSLFKEDGYFIFTTPLTGYEILSGKMITVLLEVLGILLIGGAAVFIDYLILSPSLPEINFDFILSSNNTFALLGVVANVILGYLVFLLITYLAMTLSKSIFAAFKFGRILAFACFIVLSKIVSEISVAFGDLISIGVNTININTGIGLFLLINTVIFMILFLSTGYLLNRKINL